MAARIGASAAASRHEPADGAQGGEAATRRVRIPAAVAPDLACARLLTVYVCASRFGPVKRILKDVAASECDDNNQPDGGSDRLALQLEDPEMTPPPTYDDDDGESEVTSQPSRSPKARVPASVAGSVNSSGSIYDYLDALETESALQLDLIRQPGSRSSRGSQRSSSSPTSSGFGRRPAVREIAWRHSDEREVQVSPAPSYHSERSSAGAHYYVGIKEKLATMTIELNDKTKTIELLKAARKKDKVKAKQVAAAADASCKEQLKQQQDKFEKDMEQHLDFAQTLVADKAALAKRCDELVAELQRASNVAGREAERFKMHLKDAKERWAAQEKGRREQWITKKTEEIKKSTIAALEPDIQLILTKGKADVDKAKETAAEERRRLQVQLDKDHEAALQRLKDEYERRLVDAREKERAKLMTRLDAADAELQQQLSTQRRRLQEEAEVMRTELNGEMRSLKLAHAGELDDLKAKEQQKLQAASEQFQKERQELAAKYETEMLALREQTSVECAQFKSQLAAKLRQEMEREKQALEAQMLQSRDAKIELVIEKLQGESRERVEAAEHKAQAKFDGERREWERKLKQTSEIEAVWMDKTRELQDKLGKLEQSHAQLRREHDELGQDARQAGDKAGELARLLRDERRQHEAATAQLEKRCGQLQADGEYVRQQQAGEAAAMRDKVESMEAHFQQQLLKVQSEHEAALGGLHERVKATVERKDQAIAGLHDELHLLQAQLDKSRALIEEQRQQLFGD